MTITSSIQVKQDEFLLKASVTDFRWLLVNLYPLTNPKVSYKFEASLRFPLHRQTSSSPWKEFYIKRCTSLGSASYQEIFTVALVFLAPTIYLKQRSKPKYQISSLFFTHLCCKNLMVFFLTAEDAAFSRALWTGAGKYWVCTVSSNGGSLFLFLLIQRTICPTPVMNFPFLIFNPLCQ